MKANINTKDMTTDIDISGIEKKRFRLDKDDNKIIYLATTDLNILPRLESAIKEINKLQDKHNEFAAKYASVSDADENNISEISSYFAEIEKAMRDQINYIFDYDVCTPALGAASVFDPVDGQFKYEYLINRLIALYEKDIRKETRIMQERISKHTAKYKAAK